jgi:hypothetical protein
VQGSPHITGIVSRDTKFKTSGNRGNDVKFFLVYRSHFMEYSAECADFTVAVLALSDTRLSTHQDVE